MRVVEVTLARAPRNAASCACPDEERRGLAHQLQIDRLADAPHVLLEERRDERRVDDAGIVDVAGRAEPRVKSRRGLLHRQHANVGGEDRVQRAGERGRLHRRRERDRRHLRERVDAGVGAASGAVHDDARPLNPFERILQERRIEAPFSCRCQPA